MTESRSLLEKLKVLVQEMGNDPCIDSEGLFGMMIEHAPVGMLLVKVGGSVIYGNEQIAQMLGWQQDELLNKDVSSFVPPDNLDSHYQRRKEFFDRGDTKYYGNIELWTREKKRVPVEMGLQMVTLSTGVRYVIVVFAHRKKTGDVPRAS